MQQQEIMYRKVQGNSPQYNGECPNMNVECPPSIHSYRSSKYPESRYAGSRYAGSRYQESKAEHEDAYLNATAPTDYDEEVIYFNFAFTLS